MNKPLAMFRRGPKHPDFNRFVLQWPAISLLRFLLAQEMKAQELP